MLLPNFFVCLTVFWRCICFFAFFRLQSHLLEGTGHVSICWHPINLAKSDRQLCRLKLLRFASQIWIRHQLDFSYMPNVFSHFKIRYEKLLFFKKSSHLTSMTSTVIANLTWNITLSISKNDSNHEIMTGSIPIKTFFLFLFWLGQRVQLVTIES